MVVLDFPCESSHTTALSTHSSWVKELKPGSKNQRCPVESYEFNAPEPSFMELTNGARIVAIVI